MEETRLDISHQHQWALPTHGLQVNTLDAHVCGQPLRLILSGVPVPRGKNVMERCQNLVKQMGHIQSALLQEPRGHADMNAALLAPPQRLDSHYSVIFLRRNGICPMSAHGIIAVATMCLEAQLIEMKAPETLIRLDTPAGLVRVFAAIENQRVSKVFMENVPSFALGQGFSVDVPQLGRVEFAAAYGGEFYAYVEAAALKLNLIQENSRQISYIGMAIGRAITEKFEFPHPLEASLGVLAGVVLHSEGVRRRTGQADRRLVSVSLDGALDRSPGGTGLCGWMALLQAEGGLKVNSPYVAEGLLNGTLVGKIAHTDVKLGEVQAIIIEIEGRAYLTGRHCFFVAEDDPFREGFRL